MSDEHNGRDNPEKDTQQDIFAIPETKTVPTKLLAGEFGDEDAAWIGEDAGLVVDANLVDGIAAVLFELRYNVRITQSCVEVIDKGTES